MTTEVTLKTLNDFVKLLESFDFNYFRHSDRIMYLKGKKQFDKIKAICATSETYAKLFVVWEKKIDNKITQRDLDGYVASLKKRLTKSDATQMV